MLERLRGGPWALVTVSVGWHGRALPVAWAVLPAPWPPGHFTPIVKALGRSGTAVWPPPGEVVARRAGLWALGTLLQSWPGHLATQPSAPPRLQGIVRHGSTTGRLSLWARGQLELTEPSGQLRPWLIQTLTTGAQRLAAAPPLVPAGVPAGGAPSPLEP